MKIERAQSAATIAFISAAIALPALIGGAFLDADKFGTRFAAFLISGGMTALQIVLYLRLRELLTGPATPRFLDTAKVAARLTGLVWTSVVMMVLGLRNLGGDGLTTSSLDVLENLAIMAVGVVTFMLGPDLIRAAPTPLRRLRAFAILQFPLGVGGAVGGFVLLLPEKSSAISNQAEGLAAIIGVVMALVMGAVVVASQVCLGLVFLDAAQFLRETNDPSSQPASNPADSSSNVTR